MLSKQFSNIDESVVRELLPNQKLRIKPEREKKIQKNVNFNSWDFSENVMVMSLWIEVLNTSERREDVVRGQGGDDDERGLGLILYDINIMLHFNLRWI